jgi:uncharacterized protein (TIGR00251 family)
MKIRIKVKPNSGKEEILKVKENKYIIYLRKPAKEGKANLELLKLLKKYFKKDVKIKSGFSSREKIIELN